jgi:hypothetical protein
MTLPMREMKDWPCHREQREHDHEQSECVIDLGWPRRHSGR